MYRCVSCGTPVQLSNPLNGTVIDCPHCGIDHLIVDNILVRLQLGPSAE